MKYLLSIILCLTIGLPALAQDEVDHEGETEKLAKSLLKSLKDETGDKFFKEFIKEKELKKVAKTLKKNHEGFDDQSVDSLYMRKLEKLKMSYDTLKSMGTKAGIDWAKVKLKSADYTIQGAPQSVKQYDLSLYIQYDKIRYKIMIYDVFLVDDDMRLFGSVKWLGLKDY